MSKKTSKSTKTSTRAVKPAAKAQPKRGTAGKPAPRKAAPEKQAAAPDTAAGPEPKAPKAPRTRDLRLPAPGTVLQKKGRRGDVRCECTVEEDGIRYQGTLYRSLSAAAMAASKDLGKGKGAQNGYLFWGIIKQRARLGDPITALERAWERYQSRVKAILEMGHEGELDTKMQAAIHKHALALEAMQKRGA